jgi:hypothetical protein
MRFNELTEEPIRDDGSLSIIKAFVDFACDRIGLDRPPQIKLIRDPKLASERRSFGGYMPGGGIEITIGNRHIMDVLRTLAHEMVHHKQDVDGRLHDGSGKDGSEHENEANAKAAVVMRLWGKMNPELFQKAALLAEGWSKKYKSSINCANPKGFSQRAHCQGRNKTEEVELEERKKKRKLKNAAYGPGPYGWYGHDAGYSGDSGGGDGGGESIENENFADGKNPQDKGDAKRHGVNTKASVSSLRKTAKQGGRKGQLAHWMANMKAGKSK